MDFSVVAANFKFLVLQGLIGIGPFIGGTLRLAIPAIILGFLLGIFVGLARLAFTSLVVLVSCMVVLREAKAP